MPLLLEPIGEMPDRVIAFAMDYDERLLSARDWR
jgi:hypothetical protein